MTGDRMKILNNNKKKTHHYKNMEKQKVWQQSNTNNKV